MKGLISAFFIGVVVTLIACLIIGGNVVQGFRVANDRYRAEVERLTQALDGSQRRVVIVERRIDQSIGRLDQVSDGLEGIKDILSQIRKQPLD